MSQASSASTRSLLGCVLLLLTSGFWDYIVKVLVGVVVGGILGYLTLELPCLIVPLLTYDAVQFFLSAMVECNAEAKYDYVATTSYPVDP